MDDKEMKAPILGDVGKCTVCRGRNIAADESAAFYLSLPEEILVLRCRTCGLRWLDPMKPAKEYAELYQSSYFDITPENYEQVVADRLMHYRERLEQIHAIMGPRFASASLLDIGAATGDFVHEALNAGFAATGIEPSQSACARAKEKYGIELIKGDFLSLDLGAATFDVIHLNHVLEHVTAPHAFLDKIYQLLGADGLLVLEVPYQFGNLVQRASVRLGMVKPRAFSVYSIHHPFFYTPPSLSRILRAHNFSLITIKSWRPYLREKLKNASNYCKLPNILFIEKYARLLHIVAREKGENIFTVAFARKNSGEVSKWTSCSRRGKT